MTTKEAFLLTPNLNIKKYCPRIVILEETGNTLSRRTLKAAGGREAKLCSKLGVALIDIILKNTDDK
jgi:hypothetical protein